MNPSSLKDRATAIFAKTKEDITKKCEGLDPKETSSIMKPLKQAEPLLNDEEFLKNLCFADDFLTKGNFKIKKLVAIIKYIGKRFNIETGRAFEKKSVTRKLSLALYYKSWWPFIACSNINDNSKTKDVVTLNILQEMVIKDKKGEDITIKPQIITIPIDNYKNADVQMLHFNESVSQNSASVCSTNESQSQSSVPVVSTNESQALTFGPDMLDDAFNKWVQNPSESGDSVIPSIFDPFWSFNANDDLWAEIQNEGASQNNLDHEF